jgi:hypothetical protein
MLTFTSFRKLRVPESAYCRVAVLVQMTAGYEGFLRGDLCSSV